MGRLKTLRGLLGALVTLASLAMPARVYADARDDYKRLEKRFSEEAERGKYRDAEQTALEMRRLAEDRLARGPLFLAGAFDHLGRALQGQGRPAEAEAAYQRALAIAEERLGPSHNTVAGILGRLGTLRHDQARYAEAEQLHKRALAIREKALPAGDERIAGSLSNLANVYANQGRFSEAEPLQRRALAIAEKALGPEHPRVAGFLVSLGSLLYDQGRFREAEAIADRVLAIREKHLAPDDPALGNAIGNLAACRSVQGRYHEAEMLYKRALAIHEKTLGPDHVRVAQTLNSLATLYSTQVRHQEAEVLYERALAIWKKAFGPDHPKVADGLNNLAIIRNAQQRHADAERLYRQALAIRQKVYGPDHLKVGQTLNNLARACAAQGRQAEAETLFAQSLAIREKLLDKGHPAIAMALCNMAQFYLKQHRWNEAKPLIERANAMRKHAAASPRDLFQVAMLRAELAWETARTEEAVRDLQEAMDFAEQQRALGSGGEQEQGQFFQQFLSAFERMVKWQADLKDLDKALNAMERGRARALLDQMELHGMDLLAGLSPEQARTLRERETQSQARMSGIEKQLQVLGRNQELSDQERTEAREKLLGQMRQAQQDYVTAYADMRNASPAYRLAVGQDRKPVTLEKLQQWVDEREGLLMEYLLGEDGAYVLVVPAGRKPSLEKLSVTQEQARVLGVDPGPLTRKRMEAILTRDNGEGLLQRLKAADDPLKTRAIAPGLASLWEALIPEAQRTSMAAGKPKRLMIIPDGPLASFPFETLATGPGEHPRLLIDLGFSIQYAPSATILVNLAQRVSVDRSDRALGVLTVGDPRYEAPPGTAGAGSMARLAPRSRYGSAGGRLSPLPFSGTESTWVAEAFAKGDWRVVQLKGDQATEANVRAKSAGRYLLHLACHGLVDQTHGNLFGALALSPGPNADNPADDGFLTLAEVYQLSLKGCELTILSACETNFGPQQRGEGVWAISRGFLVAGSDRVIASNWLVDDEAAASLVSYFCGLIARDEKAGKPPDYAKALHEAKRWVRQQEKWRSPYYWGTFVLVGPN